MNYFHLNGKKVPVNIIESETEFDISFQYFPPLVNRIKESLESKRWDPETKHWICKKTPRNIFILTFLLGHNVYELYDGQLVNKHKASVESFWYHQEKMYNHILQRFRCIIAGEMRTGKTLPTLTAIRDISDGLVKEGKPPIEAWWIAPKSALNGLKRELAKWHYPYKIYLLTYDRFRRIYDESTDVPQFIVFDECQKLKNPKSKQGVLARILSQRQREKWGSNAYMVLLSGTPAPKDPSDWWNLVEVCQPGFLREGNIHLLKQTLGEWERRDDGNAGQSYHKLIRWKKDQVERLHRRLDGLVEVFLKKDCLDLPDKEYVVHSITPSSEYIAAAEFVKNTTDGAAQVLNKLRQISDGFLYMDGEYDEERGVTARETKYFDNCPKDEAWMGHLDEMEDLMEAPRLITYCGYQATVDKLTSIAIKKDWTVLKIDGRNWDVYNTTRSIEFVLSEMDGSLNTNTIEKIVVIAQADAASTGLEFSASPRIIYYSNSFNGAARMQSEDRPYSNNMDKQRGLEIIDYVHLPTDLLVRNNLLNKKTLQSVTLGEIIESLEGIF